MDCHLAVSKFPTLIYFDCFSIVWYGATYRAIKVVHVRQQIFVQSLELSIRFNIIVEVVALWRTKSGPAKCSRNENLCNEQQNVSHFQLITVNSTIYEIKKIKTRLNGEQNHHRIKLNGFWPLTKIPSTKILIKIRNIQIKCSNSPRKWQYRPITESLPGDEVVLPPRNLLSRSGG